MRLAKVNAMEEMELAKRFEIRGFPTLKYFKHGVIPRDYQGPRKAEVSHDSGYSSLIRRIASLLLCYSNFIQDANNTVTTMLYLGVGDLA